MGMDLLAKIKEDNNATFITACSSEYEANQKYQQAKTLEEEGQIVISKIEVDGCYFTLKAKVTD